MTGPRARAEVAAMTSLVDLARHRRLAELDDRQFVELLELHRWGIGRLAQRTTPPRERAQVNALVLVTHGLLHDAPRSATATLGDALLRLRRALPLSAAVFAAAAILTALAVLAEPLLASSIVPRAMLAEIHASAWGARESRAADLGMTLFYWGNNLRAALLALALGALGGLPALLPIAFNGALLGAVAGISIERGAGLRLLGWIAPHGVPELGALILCAAIGWELGRGWLEPGPLRRRVAFADTARALTPALVLATVMVLAAAPLEGFIAPLELPVLADASIAVSWLALLGAVGLRAVRRERARPARR